MPIARISASEYREQASKPAKRKYRNEPVVIDGIRFDSKREGAYYAELKIREKAGEVASVERQKTFILQINNVLVGTYRADFVFYDNGQKRWRTVDVKGFETKEFKRTKRLMRACHGIEVEVVK